MNRQLNLYIPTKSELEYRRYLIADKDTMSYNIGYGDNGGCTYQQSSKQVQKWYENWVNDSNNFYAYIFKTCDNAFIGEVNLHKNSQSGWFEMGIVIENKYRSKGYGTAALKLLLTHAFEIMGAEAVHNDFNVTRFTAHKTHISAGFTEISSVNGILELLITREQYYRKKSMERMISEIRLILLDNTLSLYLYGSVVLNDFRLGWSDIDILCLTKTSITESQAEQLVNLRQKLLAEEPENQYYHLFEGGILTLEAFLNGTSDKVVYWGTSGQRITDVYTLDSFSMAQILEDGILLYGEDVRLKMQKPLYNDMYNDVIRYNKIIRKYAVTVGRSIKSYGWLLDIARCIHTLRTGQIISKTAAGEWALKNNICPVPFALENAVKVRKEPLKYQNDEQLLNNTKTLGQDIQKFAYVIDKELMLYKLNL